MTENGFLWRKYVCPCKVDPKSGPVLVRTKVGKKHPHLTRWQFLEDAEIGFVYMDPDGPPTAVCYDLVVAAREFESHMGKTRSHVIDSIYLMETFQHLLLNAFFGADTPFFWSSHDVWSRLFSEIGKLNEISK